MVETRSRSGVQELINRIRDDVSLRGWFRRLPRPAGRYTLRPFPTYSTSGAIEVVIEPAQAQREFRVVRRVYRPLADGRCGGRGFFNKYLS